MLVIREVVLRMEAMTTTDKVETRIKTEPAFLGLPRDRASRRMLIL